MPGSRQGWGVGGGPEKASVVAQGVCSRAGMRVKGPGPGRVVWSGILASFKKATPAYKSSVRGLAGQCRRYATFTSEARRGADL